MRFFSKKKEPAVLRKKVKQRRLSQLQVQILIGIAIAIVIALIVTAVWYVTRVESFQIEGVEVIGGETIAHSEIETVINEELTGTYLRLIPKRFIPLYPKQKIIDAVRALDRVKQVEVEIGENQTVTVLFEEYIPYALWCPDAYSQSCLFMDATGYAFSQAPLLTGSAFVRYIHENTPPHVGTVAFDNEYISQTETFIGLLIERLSLYVTHVAKIGSYDVEYTISGGGVIKVSQSIPMEETFANLETILSSEEFIHIEPGSFEYIDLRFGDKVFVNEVKPESASTTASTTVEDL